MKTKTFQLVIAALLATGGTLFNLEAQDSTSADPHGWIGTGTVKTPYGDFDFKNGYPTPEAADALLDQLKFNRAVEVTSEHKNRAPRGRY